ncbi:MAG: M56 family metallopeptidase [Bacteroides sp.]|jgi:TonB family protein|nr:M56 family metallopeptidase [Bacteroides sp.]
MNTLFTFLFWTSAYFILLGLVYHFLVRPQNNPGFSRVFLLGGLLLSLLAGFGFLVRTLAFNIPEANGVLTLPEVVVFASEGLEQSQMKIRDFLFSESFFMVITLLVSGFLMIRFAGSVLYLAIQGRMVKAKRIRQLMVIPMKGDKAPFSFFSLVFVPERLLFDPALDQVLLHEQAHAKNLHSLDLIFLELLSIFFWFHPVIWYLRREIKMQHEYEADRFVLNQHTDKAGYQQLLLSFSFTGHSLPITNPFNFSPLKKRIMMMNKQTKNPVMKAILSLTFSTGLFAMLLLLQSATIQATQPPLIPSEPEVVNLTVVGQLPESAPQPPSPPPPPRRAEPEADVIFTVVEDQPRFPGGEEARVQYMVENLRYPEEARDDGIQGTVFVTFVVEEDGNITGVKVLRGIGGGCDEEAVRVVKNMPTWTPGRQRGQNVRVQYNMPIRFVLNGGEKKEDTPGADMLRERIGTGEIVIFIDGEKIDAEVEDLNEIIKVEEIESMNVFRGEKARELYGHENVIAITRKKAEQE